MLRTLKDIKNTIVLSGTERHLHPVAGRIPGPIWRDCQDLGMSGLRGMYAIELYLMIMPLDEILSDEAYAAGIFKIPYNEKVAWVCIAVAHPEATIDQLCLAAERLGIMPKSTDAYTKTSLFKVAAGLGYVGILQRIIAVIDPASKNYLISGPHEGETYRLAAQCGQTNVLRYLESEYTDCVDKLLYNASSATAFYFAALQGNDETCHYLLSKAFVFNLVDLHERSLPRCQEKYITPFILSNIAALKRKLEMINQEKKPDIDDLIDGHQVDLCLIMLRNIIRLNDRGMDANLVFLLGIRSVKAMLMSGHLVSYNELLGIAITSRNFIGVLLILNSNAELVSLDLSKRNLSDEDFMPLVEDLFQCPQITNLNLANNYLSDESVTLLATMTHLKKLDVSHNRIGKKGLVSLVLCENLHELKIDNNLNDEDSARISAVTDPIDKVNLAVNYHFEFVMPSLQTLSLYACKKHKVDVSNLGPELRGEVERQRI